MPPLHKNYFELNAIEKKQIQEKLSPLPPSTKKQNINSPCEGAPSLMSGREEPPFITRDSEGTKVSLHQLNLTR